VIRLIQAYDELLADRHHLASTVRRLTPVWAEVREVLNEMVEVAGRSIRQICTRAAMVS
jgi:hypothetical protein